LVEIIRNNEYNILKVCRDTGLIEKYGSTEKTWKNRITEMKTKHGLEIQEQKQ
jgi:hypothetical protein